MVRSIDLRKNLNELKDKNRAYEEEERLLKQIKEEERKVNSRKPHNKFFKMIGELFSK